MFKVYMRVLAQTMRIFLNIFNYSKCHKLKSSSQCVYIFIVKYKVQHKADAISDRATEKKRSNFELNVKWKSRKEI